MSNELPTFTEVKSASEALTEQIHGSMPVNAYTYFAFIEGATWMREKALKALAEEKEMTKHLTGEIDKLTDFIVKNYPSHITEGGAVDNAIYIINQQSKELQQEKERHEWIDIQKQLPDREQVVIRLWHKEVVEHSNQEPIDIGRVVDKEGFRFVNVIKWKPLPELPKNY